MGRLNDSQDVVIMCYLGSVRSGTRSLSKAMAQLVEKFDQGEEGLASSKSSDHVGHLRSSSMVTTPKSGVFKPTRPSLPPQFMGDKHVGANNIADGTFETMLAATSSCD